MGSTSDTVPGMAVEGLRRLVLDAPNITEFQRKVYLAVLEIPAGTVITYGELARRIGCRSARAVGQALARNPFAPVVPCHRVIRADSHLGGYLGCSGADAMERKAALLLQEGYNNPPHHK